MRISETCIERPVFATVLSLVILLIGIICWQRLTVREYPRIDEPVVSVNTTYKGASAEVVESQITKPLEDSLSGMEGVEVLTSSSRSERSQINVRFRITRDPDSAAADVRDKVARVRSRLPDSVDEPVIAKVEADASPILFVSVEASDKSAVEISDYISRYIKPRLSVLPGAADVRIFGERQLVMRIWLKPDRLAAYKLTVQDVEDALRRQNVEVPAGRIESQLREFPVVARTELNTPEQFEAVVIATVNGYPITLREVADISVGSADERVISRYMGKSALNIGVIKQSTANPLELSQAVRSEVEKINTSVPQGMRLVVSYDTSVFIEKSIESVVRTIVEAIILVVLVIFFFLRNLRATLIPIVTIPLSLIGAAAIMYALGFSINTLTLLAMVLAIGLVVDDAIVVLENIFRHIENGMPRKEAALRGAREIGFAVLAMTLTLAAVYAPLAFATGRTGRLFIEFALTLAGAVLVSGFVALTLSPMMCGTMLRHEAKHGRLYLMIERGFNTFTQLYQRSLLAALRHRVLVLVLAAVTASASVWLFSMLKSELAPIEDRGVIFGRLSGPEGATVSYLAKYLEPIEKKYASLAETNAFTTVVGFPTVADGNAILRLKPWDQRTRKQQEIAKELAPVFSSLPGVRGFPAELPSLGQPARSTPIEYVILSSTSYEDLQRMTQKILAEAAQNSGIINLQSDLKLDTPELRVKIDRSKLADIGVSVETVGRTLETLLGGRQVTRFKNEGEQYDVLVQMNPADRTSPSAIPDIYVRNRAGDMVQLANVVSLREGVAPQSLNHFNRLRSVTLTGTLSPGYTIGQALDYLDSLAKKHLPSTAQTDTNGQSREFRSSAGGIYFTFILALAFIYLVLAAQFESFVDPFIIMLSVPLSMTGALLALWLTGGTLNIYSQIGLITLVGLITKHGILIVEFTNQLRAEGKVVQDALVEACVLRLRPILMTTGAMVLGAIPLALAHGAGAESRQPIGWVIVGGLMLGTLLTLYVVPTVYTLLARKKLESASTTTPTTTAA